MTLLSPDRNCSVCKKIMTFDEFLINHPQFSVEKALFIWNDKLLTTMCPKCFFNAPEKPYRKSRYRALNFYLID